MIYCIARYSLCTCTLGKKRQAGSKIHTISNSIIIIIIMIFFPKTADMRQRLRRRFSSSVGTSFVSVGSEWVGNVGVKVTLPWPPGVGFPERVAGEAEQQQSWPQQEQEHSQQHSHYHTRPLPAWGSSTLHHHYIIITSSLHHHYIIITSLATDHTHTSWKCATL